MQASPPDLSAPKAGFFRAAVAWLWSRPRLLLALTFFFWATNFIAGKRLAETFPPVGLACLRWSGAAIILLILARPHLQRDWPAVRRHWFLLLLMAASGIGAYNTLAYRGLHDTEVINAVLTQSSAPLLIALWSIVLFGDWLTRRQLIGIAISSAGVLMVLTRGHLENLLAIRINTGDLFFLAAMLLYSFYSALLRRRPAVHPLSFLAIVVTGGALMLIPVWGLEIASGSLPLVTGEALAWLVYLVLFPSIVAYLCFNRGVELLGANAAGPYFHLMPLFVAVLAITFLGERLEWFHPIGFVLIVGGVVLATTGRKSAGDPA